MRLSEQRIREAIVHPWGLARDTAAHYFKDSYSRDPAVMEKVLEAFETYGWKDAFLYFHFTLGLPLNERALGWVIDQLRRPRQEPEHRWNSFVNFLNQMLSQADVELLVSRESEILDLETLEEEHREAITERIRLFSTNSEECWQALEEFCQREKDAWYLSDVDLPAAQRLVEALARDKDRFCERFLTELTRPVSEKVGDPHVWMWGFAAEFAGLTGWREAVPALVAGISPDGDWHSEQASEALARIGTDEVVNALASKYSSMAWEERLTAVATLGKVKTSRSLEAILRHFVTEKNESVATFLANAASSHFDTDVIEPLRARILAQPGNRELQHVRDELVVLCMLSDTTIPELDAWKDQAEKSYVRNVQFALDAKNWSGGLSDDLSEANDLAERIAAFDDAFQDRLLDEEEGFLPRPSAPFVSQQGRVGRNERCPCGSGKKYKHCCLRKEETQSQLD